MSLKSFLLFLGYSLLWLALIGFLYQSWQSPPPQNISDRDISFSALRFPSLDIIYRGGNVKGAKVSYIEPVKVTWPREMESDCSDSITVMIDHIGDSYIVTKRSGLATTSGNLDLSNLKVNEPLPENYELYVTAKLAANNFHVTLNSEEWQPLDNRRLSWVWNISPKQAGSQIINLSIQAEIRDKTTGQKQQETSESVWSDELAISVNKSWLSKEQINITSIISLIIGAGLTIPWIYERVQERRKKKKSKSRSNVKAKK